jgi:hypothetical protein
MRNIVFVNAKEVSNGTYAVAQCPGDRCSVFVCGVNALHLSKGNASVRAHQPDTASGLKITIENARDFGPVRFSVFWQW